MAKKKKQAESAVEVPTFDQSVGYSEHDPITPSLTENELLKLKLAEAETKLANLSANIKLIERNQYIAKIDPEGKLTKFEQEIKSYIEQASACKSKYNEIIASIESRVGIKMADYSYDDETGALIPITM